MGLMGLVWLVAPLGLMVPDVGHLLGIVSILLMFVSPIAFRPDMVPGRFRALLQLNPVTYMVGAYRWTIIGPAAADGSTLIVFGALAGVAFVLGGLFCWRFKGFVIDFE